MHKLKKMIEIFFSERLLLIVSFAAGLAITVFGFIILYESPYTGLILSVCNNSTCVDKVDDNSPASAVGIEAGDILVAVNGEEVPFFVFSRDPDWVRWREDHKVFREWRRRLDKTVIKNEPLALTVRRNEEGRETTLIPVHFPFIRALGRSLPVYFGSWGAAVLAFLVLRKRASELSYVNFTFWIFVCLNGASLATYTVRDIAFSASALKILSLVNHLGSWFALSSLLHFTMIFPRRKKLLETHPWTAKALYIGAAVVFVLDSAEIFRDTYLTLHALLSAGLTVAVVRLVYGLVKERDPILRKQAQWVVFGMSSTGAASVILYILPVMFGGPVISETFLYPVMMIASLSFVFAITRYRLMDIENIFDNAVVYGITIVILQAAELAFLGVAAPYLDESRRAPLTMMLGVLLIVFLYLPLRNATKNVVEKFFKRGSYDTDQELRKFIAGLGVCDNTSAIDKFSSYAKRLFAPSGLFVITFKAGQAGLFSIGEKNEKDGARILASASGLLRYFERRRASLLGYDLSDRGVLKSAMDLESALFVPFFAENELAFLAVLLKKENGTIYSRKDSTLLDAISVQLTHILEAEERRRELENERLRMAREIHDGIGSEFTGILSFGERGARSLDGLPSSAAAKDYFTKIIGASRRGIRELRNIIWALNTEKQTLQVLSANVKRYAADVLNENNVDVTMRDGGLDDDTVLPPAVFLFVFRSVQELCHNVLKHAGADGVAIEFRKNGRHLSLSFSDNGRGFLIGPAFKKTGNGLNNIQKRAEELGGAATVSSSPGNGTAVELMIPLA